MPSSNSSQPIEQSCLRTTDRVTEALISYCFRRAPLAEEVRSDFSSRLAHRRCAAAVSVASCAWIHRRCVWSARRHDRRAANILGSWYPLSAVRTKIAELLRLSTEVHCPSPTSGFALAARASVAELRDFVESGLERACDRSNYCLRNIGGFKGVTEREANCAPSDARSGVRNGKR